MPSLTHEEINRRVFCRCGKARSPGSNGVSMVCLDCFTRAPGETMTHEPVSKRQYGSALRRRRRAVRLTELPVASVRPKDFRNHKQLYDIAGYYGKFQLRGISGAKCSPLAGTHSGEVIATKAGEPGQGRVFEVVQ